MRRITKISFLSFSFLAVGALAVGIAGAKTISVDFRSPTIQKRNIDLSVQGAVYNNYYGQSWLMLYPGRSKIIGRFELPDSPARAILTITHLSSAGSRAKGGGYSPINVILNKNSFKYKYDVAENHGGNHSYNTDSWDITSYLHRGSNMMELQFCSEAQTHYWIQNFSIEIEEKTKPPAFEPSEATIGLPKKKIEKWDEVFAGPLEKKLICSSYMENYRYQDIFLVKSVMYIPHDRRVDIEIGNIERDFRDRTRFLISFENIPVNNVKINGKECSQRGNSFLYGNVNWYSVNFDSPLQINLHLDRFHGRREAFFTIIATQPTIPKRLFDEIARKSLSPVISLLKLLGVADKGGIAFAKFAFALDLENPANCKISEATIRLLSTESKVKETIKNVITILSKF